MHRDSSAYDSQCESVSPTEGLYSIQPNKWLLRLNLTWPPSPKLIRGPTVFRNSKPDVHSFKYNVDGMAEFVVYASYAPRCGKYPFAFGQLGVSTFTSSFNVGIMLRARYTRPFHAIDSMEISTAVHPPHNPVASIIAASERPHWAPISNRRNTMEFKHTAININAIHTMCRVSSSCRVSSQR